MDTERGMMKKVLVKGPILSRSGYGEHARFVLRSLRHHEDKFDIYAENTTWGHTGWLYSDTEERRWLDSIINKTAELSQEGGQVDLSLQVTIPNEWQPLAPINVGITAGIETTQIAPEWITKSQIVNKIITISEHSKKIYEGTSYTAVNNDTGETIDNFKCTTPIDIVHYPVREHEPEEINLDLTTKFNFLIVAQWAPRKNLDNTIRWFVEEFIDQEVGLVVKTNVANNSIIDRYETEKRIKNILSPYEKRKCKVHLLHGDMTDEEMTSLYKKPEIKALVTLTHGEGFGLPLFEAAYNELPVIAPNWSGHLDFLYKPTKDKKGKVKMKAHFAKLDYDIGPIQSEIVWDGVLHKDSMWCYPQQGSYKMRLREVYKDHGRFKKMAKDLKKWICEEFEKTKQYDKMVDSILSVVPETEEHTVRFFD